MLAVAAGGAGAFLPGPSGTRWGTTDEESERPRLRPVSSLSFPFLLPASCEGSTVETKWGTTIHAPFGLQRLL